MALHDFYSPGERERIARGEFNSTQVQLRELLEGTGARRVEVECAGVGLHQFIRPWLIEEDGGRRPVEVDEACPSVESLREWQALPGRGAWFRSRLWMDAEEKVLHQESDWMGEPVFDPDGEPDLYHYWAELDYFPRDEELVPHWLRRKVERWEAERAPAFNGRIAELEEEFYALTHGPRGSQQEREAVRTGRLPRLRGGAEFDLVRDRVGAWLADSGAERVDVYIEWLGSSQRIDYRLTTGGESRPVPAGGGVAEAVERLRGAQASPRYGAWMRSHLWMDAEIDADRGVLHQQSQWQDEPDSYSFYAALGDEMTQEQALERARALMRKWLEDNGGTRLDVDCNSIGPGGRHVTHRVTVGGERKKADVDVAVDSAVRRLRRMQVIPGRGAWLYSHVWLELPEGVLHQESDWMCEPEIDPYGLCTTPDGLDFRQGELDPGEYKTEVDWFPRDQEFIPDWLRDRLEQWRLEGGHIVARRITQLEEEHRLGI